MENFSDDENFEESDEGQENLKNRIGGKGIIQLKSNFISNSLIRLDKLFDHNDVAKTLQYNLTKKTFNIITLV